MTYVARLGKTDVAGHSPIFFVGDEMFWGDDRLEEAIAWATGKHPAQR